MKKVFLDPATIKAGDKILVHLFDVHGKEIITDNHGETFEVHSENGRLGIDWNDFAPLESFSTENGKVIFEKAV